MDKLTEKKALKVLLIHSRYDPRVPSGENDLFDSLKISLQVEGIQAESLEFSNKWSPASKFTQALTSLLGVSGVAQFRKRVRTFSPDIVHFVNLFPRVDPRVIRLANDTGSKTVVSINNYRLACLNGLFLFRGSNCEKCASTKWSLPGVKRRCYRRSFLGSLLAAQFRRRMLKSKNQAHLYVANSEFVREKIEGQLHEGMVAVRRNYLHRPSHKQRSSSSDLRTSNMFLFVGRLSKEKGIIDLCEAFRQVEDPRACLMIAGDGPQRDIVDQARRADKRIQPLGRLDKREIEGLMLRSRAVVVPSICFEAGETIVAHEAISLGVPVLVRAGTSPARWLQSFPELIFDDSIDGLASILKRFAELTDQRRLEESLRHFYQESFEPLASSLSRTYESLLTH